MTQSNAGVTPRFITFEGGEGAGKGTQIKRLSDWLDNNNIDHITTRAPGSTEGAELIRELLVTGLDDRWDDVTEALLFFAARRDTLRKVIWPALQSGKWVICDRFVHSTYAYQGYGRGMNLELLKQLYHVVSGNKKDVDVTFILDISPKDGIARTRGRTGADKKENRYENIEIDFHDRVREGYLTMAKNDPEKFSVIRATDDIDTVFKSITKTIETKFLSRCDHAKSA